MDTVDTVETRTRTKQRGASDVAGNCVLARAGELALLCELAPGHGERVGALVDTLAAVAVERACGRELTRRLAGLVSVAGPGGLPAWCAFGPTGNGVAVMVHGRAELILDLGGRELRLDGRESATVVDRVVSVPVASIRAVIGDAATDLHVDVDVDAGSGPDLVGAGADSSLSDSAPAVGGDLVIGVYCRRSHFNDPNMAYCTVCGISMAQANRMPVLGRRPALGVLVLDDGSMQPLVRDLVFGRAPEADEAVLDGSADPVRLTDATVSRVHARIVLDGWDVSVLDAGSTNGTFLCVPGQSSWTRIPPGGRAALQPGSAAAFGRRQLRYHSHRAQSVDFSSLEPVHLGRNVRASSGPS